MQGFSRIGRIALEIPVASKSGTPKYLSSKTHVVRGGYTYKWSCFKCIGELWNPAQLTQTTTIIRWVLTRERVVSNGKLVVLLF